MQPSRRICEGPEAKVAFLTRLDADHYLAWPSWIHSIERARRKQQPRGRVRMNLLPTHPDGTFWIFGQHLNPRSTRCMLTRLCMCICISVKALNGLCSTRVAFGQIKLQHVAVFTLQLCCSCKSECVRVCVRAYIYIYSYTHTHTLSLYIICVNNYIEVCM